jgi:phosphonate transport system substrate-binding protein
MFKRQFILSAVALAALVGCASTSTSSPTPPLSKIVIGVQAAKPDETRAAWLPLVQDIGKKNNIATELVTASQAEIVAALRDGKIDVAWLSSSTAIDAVVDANAQAFALYFNVNGTNGYKGVIITRSDSGITTLDQAFAPGKYSYAGGPKTSTSGYVLPQALLFSKRNTTPDQLFKSVTLGGHFPNLDLLWGKKVDIAVNNTTDLAVFQERNPEAKAGIRVLWESPLVPNDVLMTRATTPTAHKAKMQAIFLDYAKTDAAEKELFRKASGIRNFIPADNKLLDPVTEFKFGAERAAIEGNTALSAADKAAQLARIDQRLQVFKKSL